MLPDVPRETLVLLRRFADEIVTANAEQNLVAPSTLPVLWERHILDSAQLVRFADQGAWLDIGSGAGLPGMVAAILRPDEPTILVEPRGLRAAFLQRCAERLGLLHVEVMKARIEAVPARTVRTISARAVAPLDRLFAMAQRFADENTLWLLPKGRSAAAELAAAREAWQGAFELVPSVTDPEARIVVARRVRPRGRQ